MRQAECMSVQEGIDGNLDIMRSVYMSAVLETEKIAEQMREEWGIVSPMCTLSKESIIPYALLIYPYCLPDCPISLYSQPSNLHSRWQEDTTYCYHPPLVNCQREQSKVLR